MSKIAELKEKISKIEKGLNSPMTPEALKPKQREILEKLKGELAAMEDMKEQKPKATSKKEDEEYDGFKEDKPKKKGGRKAKAKKENKQQPTCDELEAAWIKRREAAKKAKKRHKTTSISESIGDTIGLVVNKAINSVSKADVKAAPKTYISKFERVEKSTKEFIDSLKSVLGDEFDRDELIKPMEEAIGKFIKDAKEKYQK